MNPSCPACGGTRLAAVADHYQAEVRRSGADPAALAEWAPPIRTSVFHGTACITLFFLAAMCPGFVAVERAFTVSATFVVLGGVSFLAWRRARRRDQEAMAVYLRRRVCLDCGWEG